MYFHEAIQSLFVFPHIALNRSALHLAIDDSSIVTWASTGAAQEYHDRYKEVVTKLGLKIKEHDPNCEKAFEPSDHGECLARET